MEDRHGDAATGRDGLSPLLEEALGLGLGTLGMQPPATVRALIALFPCGTPRGDEEGARPAQVEPSKIQGYRTEKLRVLVPGGHAGYTVFRVPGRTVLSRPDFDLLGGRAWSVQAPADARRPGGRRPGHPLGPARGRLIA